MSDMVPVAEEHILSALRARGGVGRGRTVLLFAADRVPMKVAHTAYWGMIDTGRLVLDSKGIVKLVEPPSA